MARAQFRVRQRCRGLSQQRDGDPRKPSCLSLSLALRRYDAVRIADRPEARDRLERFLSVWEEQGCRMVEMSAGQHDAHAASSQFVTHLTGRLLGNLELGVVENTIADSWDLFYGLYKFNEANAQHIIAAVRDSLTELVRQLEDTDAKT